MPIDRQNKERAIKVLKVSSELAKNDKLCIVIAPEGTRSTTGNLLPYKKGAFHMWKDLNCPIVPFIMYGTYDLYPTGTWINNTGKVAIRYLKPITPDELKGKAVDEVLRIVRRRTLEALAECPKNICTPLTWGERLYSVFFTFLLYAFNTFVAYRANDVLFHKYGFDHWSVYGWLLGAVIAITASLYIYNLYILPNLYSIPVDKKEK
jgi:1-acyl-sn-glycerol-3-phosphate acyltransferase